MVMQPLSDTDHGRIADAIRGAEADTAGEIFVVVARESDDYRILPVLWAALLTLAGGLAAAALMPNIAAGSLALGQAAVLAVLVVLTTRLPRLRLLCVPRMQRRRLAAQRARQQFLAHNLHATESRTGVLIYIGLAERHAEIVADARINARVPLDFWQDIVDGLTLEIAAGRLVDGLVAAVAACGQTLAEHFPRQSDDRNELPDRLVEI